jgi:two-component system cell cycle sensor histidine kinase/response regulator CckA
MSPETGPCGSECILVVDDDPPVLSITCALLARGGYTVLQAESGERALELCAGGKQEIDLLLTDVIMPKMQGPQLADRFLAMFPQARVLFMSGFQDYQFERKTSEAVGRLLPKPFSSETLLAAVRAALDEPRKRAPNRESSGGGIRGTG